MLDLVYGEFNRLAAHLTFILVEKDGRSQTGVVSEVISSDTLDERNTFETKGDTVVNHPLWTKISGWERKKECSGMA